MQVNVMGDAPDSETKWNDPFFRECFDNVIIIKMVTWIDRKQKPVYILILLSDREKIVSLESESSIENCVHQSLNDVVSVL